MRIMGVDPGGSGALSCIETSTMVVIDCIDMPVFLVQRGKSDKPRLNTAEVIDFICRNHPTECWFELVGGQEHDGPSRAFNFGRITGACEASIAAAKIPIRWVAPHVWKKALTIRGKDAARAEAVNFFPNSAELFKLKKNDGRAEATLIAVYGARQPRLANMRSVLD